MLGLSVRIGIQWSLVGDGGNWRGTPRGEHAGNTPAGAIPPSLTTVPGRPFG